jgi:hypothetical protein
MAIVIFNASPAGVSGSFVINAGGAPSIKEDIFANLPAPGNVGALFVATDTHVLYRDNGASWDVIGTSIVAEQGLHLTGGNSVRLGGVLNDGNAGITLNGNQLEFVDNDSSGNNIDNVFRVASQILSNTDPLGNSADFNINILGGTNAVRVVQEFVNNGGSAKRIAIDGVTFVIEDQIANQGIQYAADYSANFVARSLIDAQFYFTNLNPKAVAQGNVTAGVIVSGNLLNFGNIQKRTYRFSGAIAYISGTGTVALVVSWNDPDLPGTQTFTYASINAAGVSNYTPFVFTSKTATNVIVDYVVVGTVDARIDGYLEFFQ